MSRTEKYNLTLAVAIALTSMCIGLMTLAWRSSSINSSVESNSKRIEELLIMSKAQMLSDSLRHKNDPVIIYEIKNMKTAITRVETRQMNVKHDMKEAFEDGVNKILLEIGRQ